MRCPPTVSSPTPDEKQVSAHGRRGSSKAASRPETAENEQQGEQIRDVLTDVAKAALPQHASTALWEPLDVIAWTRAFDDALRLPARETEPIFKILDGMPFGPGDGFVPLKRLEFALAKLTTRAAADADDPIY